MSDVTGDSHIRRVLVEELSRVLQLDAERIDGDLSFADYGLDSILGAAFVRKVSLRLELALSVTTLYDIPTLNSLAAHLAARAGATRQITAAADPDEASPRPGWLVPKRMRQGWRAGDKWREAPTSPTMASIAIIGMSCRFAQAENAGRLWEHLSQGRDLVGPVTRWKLPSDCCSQGSLLDAIDRFDARFFNISGVEARYMDPTQRIFLEEAWTALEDAGYAGDAVNGARCGIYVGCSAGDYSRLFEGTPPYQAAWGNAASIVPARIAYFLNLQGPAVAIDTACSSSLVAIHLACQALRSREIELALAGGVNVQSTPELFLTAGRAGMLSSRGRCHSFDNRADGFVPGEGAGVVVLKRLDDAVADGDHVHAVILGSAINQDGTTNGITAPSARSQERLERQVYEAAGIDPASIGMVEAHGTGTALGDPIEFEALVDAFGGATTESAWCALGSIKSNLGHTTSAAGVAGLMRILLALRYRQIPPALHFATANPNIRLAGSPFYVNTTLRAWEGEAGRPRRAGLSSFGFSGTNAHAVIEEAPLNPCRHAEQAGYLVVLSAQTAPQLRLQAENLIAWCRDRDEIDVGNISFTLLQGRKHFQHRLAVVVHDGRSLVEALGLWRDGGAVRHDGHGGLAEMAERFMRGEKVAAAALFARGGFSRLSLPTYPFEHDRYWCTDGPTSGDAAMSVMTFVEELVELAATPGDGQDGRTIVSVVCDRSQWGAIVAALGLDVEVIFGESTEPRDFLALLRRIAAEPERPPRLLLAGEFGNLVQRCHLDAWVAAERSLRRVWPDTRISVVLRDRGEAASWVSVLQSELNAANPESAVYENGRRYVYRARPVTEPVSAPALKPGGTYLITGGRGALGTLVARHLRDRYNANLVLIGRSESASPACADVLDVTADVCDQAQMRGAVAAARERFGRIDGVIHAAGAYGTHPLQETTPEEWRAVLAPKIEGTLSLEGAIADEPLDFICYFSSASSVLGDFGGCDYAVANRFQSAYAGHAVGGRRIAIQWPLWADGNMTFDPDGTRLQLQSSGQRALETPEALELLDRLLGAAAGQRLVLAGEPAIMHRLLGIGAEDAMLATLQSHVSRLLAVPVDRLDPSRNLVDFGFDSLSLVAFAKALDITPAVFFTHSTLAKLALHLRSRGEVPSRAAAPDQVATPRLRHAGEASIAVIGMSGRFPSARCIADLWEMLRDGASGLGRAPAGRRGGWQESPHRGGFVPGAGEFDPLFFEISPREAESMDPRQRLLLQEGWNALEDAGYGEARLATGRTAMFVGVEEGDYQQLTGAQGNVTSTHAGILASRLAYFLDFHGPVMAINTACSSGLVAAHLACESLRNGECDTAVVAGVNLMLTPSAYTVMDRAGMLSPDGTCRPFDEHANGIVPGEAVVVVVLRRFSDAVADGDPVDAVIVGSGINYDGRTNGITAPSGEAQTNLAKSIYARFAINPRQIGCVIAHGTATHLGDPVEVNALADAFRAHTADERFCALVSTKGNFGHTLAASGLVSFVALVESLRHETIPLSVGCTHENKFIEWQRSPFFVSRENRPWPASKDGTCTGAVSSFGISGTNAHMVMRSHRPPRPEGVAPTYLVAVSAKTEEALRERIRDTIAALDGGDGTLAEVSYTLLTGRCHFAEYRYAVVAADRAEAIAALRATIGRVPSPPSGDGPTDRGRGLLLEARRRRDDPQRHRELTGALAELFRRNVDVRWSELFEGESLRRVHLPGYPFPRETYWLGPPSPDKLHPLVHRDISAPGIDRFVATFRGDEFFLADHRLRGTRVLPAVAYLEMARAAVAMAFGEAGAVTLNNVAWLVPITVIEKSRVAQIELEPKPDGTVAFVILGETHEVFCRGTARRAAIPAARVDLDATLARCPRATVTMRELYSYYAGIGLDYGPSMRGLCDIRVGSNELVARIEMPREASEDQLSFVLNPAVADAALHAVIAFHWDVACAGEGRLTLPFFLESVDIIAPCTPSMHAVVRLHDDGNSLYRVDVDLCDESGTVRTRIRGLNCRLFDGPEVKEPKAVLLRPVWRHLALAAPYPSRASDDRRIVILCDLDHIDPVRIGAAAGVTRCVAFTSTKDRPLPCFADLAEQLLDVLQPMLASGSAGSILLQLVTASPLSAALSALLSTASVEQPRITGQVVILEDGESEAGLVAKLRESAATAGTRKIRYQGADRLTTDWCDIDHTVVPQPLPWRAGGVYLITGGAGSLGMIFAKEISRSVDNAVVVLCGRSPGTGPMLSQIAMLGPKASYRQTDVTDRGAMAALVASILAEHGRLNGAIHAAGVLRDDFLLRKTRDSFRDVLAPKVTGLVNLDEATRHVPLDFFIVFASASGVVAKAGQGDYATANAYLDCYAEYRNRLVAAKRRRGRTLSIDWPLWQQGGMQVGPAMSTRIGRLTGLIPLDTGAGIDAFYRAWASGAEQVLVLYGDETEIRRLAEAPERAPTAAPEHPAPISACNGDDSHARAVELVKGILSDTLKLPSGTIDADAPLERYGIDSLMAMDLTSALEGRFGPLPKTLFFEYQTLSALAGYFVGAHRSRLEQALSGAETPLSGTATPVQSASETPDIEALADKDDDIAIIGVAGRYPQADDIEMFSANLLAGRDCITELPAGRWPMLSPDEREPVWGGFIDGVDCFDARFFGISPREAEIIDPQERLFLECAHATIEDAGYTRQSLLRCCGGSGPGASVGVFVGVMYEEYQLYGAQETLRGTPLALSGSPSSIANRVSYYFNLDGPSLAVDTMCSSSLSAIHLACKSLQRGECRMALAGGVNVSVHPNKYRLLRQGHFMSSDGRCRSFGAGGDGYVPAEGVGAVLLKPRSAAEADGDRIYGVIKASAVNHGGKTNGYTVPNPVAQAAVIARALAEAGLPSRAVSYIEAHGTGTSLGDPIEIAALNKVFDVAHGKQYCAIGSVKSNIGHAESASGIAGLTKVLLQLKHRMLVPSLHSDILNPYIDFAGSAFVVQQTAAAWERPSIELDGVTTVYPRIAGISSFGAGGANAHVVIAESISSRARTGVTPLLPVLIVLSAKTTDRLKVCAARLGEALRASHWSDTDLADIAYTLQIGREAMEERLALIAHSLQDVRRSLEAFVAGATDASLYLGRQRHAAEQLAVFGTDLDATVDRVIANRNLARVAQFWVDGVALDWERLYGEVLPRRVGLPTYQFVRERCWFAAARAEPSVRRTSEPAVPAIIFSEVRVEVPAVAGGPPIRVLVCLLSGTERCSTVTAESSARSYGTRIVFVGRGATFCAEGIDRYTINPADRDDYIALFRHVAKTYGEIDALCHLWQLDDPSLAANPVGLLPFLQALSAAPVRPKRVVLAGDYRDALTRSHLASWISIERSLRMQTPGVRTTVLMWPRDEGEDWATRLWRELTAQNAASVIYESGKRFVHRVERVVATEMRTMLRQGGTYLITGGVGALGHAVARHLVERWSARLILVGRSAELDHRKRERLDLLQRLSGDVVYDPADVCDARQMHAVWQRAKERFGAIHGVVHAAGGAGAEALAAKTRANWQEVVEPKVVGTCVLDEISVDEALDFICYFTSSSAVLGDFGACDYAIASRFQMAYAEYMPPVPGRKRVAIAWPMWRDGGLALDGEAERLYLNSSGQRLLESAEATVLFEQLLGQGAPHRLVMAGERERIERFLGVDVPHVAMQSAVSGTALAARVDLELREQAGRILKIRHDELDSATNLADLGFNSILLGELADALSTHLGIEVNPALFFAHPTLHRLGLHLVSEHRQVLEALYDARSRDAPSRALVGGSEQPAVRRVEPRPQEHEPIAVIGVSCRFPMSADLDEFWRNLLAGRDCTTEVPPERWDWREFDGDPGRETNKTRVHRGGFIDGIDEFDPLFFGISPREAGLMDPQQRLLLTYAWKAIEDAGYSPASLGGSNTAVFVGTANTGYSTLVERAGGAIDGHSSTGSVASIGSNRLSHFLDLHGPSEPIETACSSALVAVRRGAQALERHECDLAIVGGVNTIPLPEGFVSFDKAGMLSPDGRCKTFSDRADGYGRGEGVGMLVLKRVSAAERDGDSILGLIRATAENHGGRGSSLTAPNPVAQAAMLQAAYAAADIDIRTVSYIEAHGTGTPLGDPVEIEGLKAAFKALSAAPVDQPYCGVGSVKSNIGHLELAAGVAGVIKVLLQLRYRTLVPTLHCETVNPHVRLDRTPFYIVRETRPWDALKDAQGHDLPRRAGVSSFGFGGVNAHVVIEEYISAQRQPSAARDPMLLVLSAKTSQSLQQQALALASAIEGVEEDDLADIAYTLQVGRDAMEERLGLIAHAREEAVQKLRAFAERGNDTDGLYRGSASQHREIIALLRQADLTSAFDRWIADGRHGEILALWTKGMEVDWRRLHGGRLGRRVSLPGYAFARERFWVSGPAPAPKLHPLVQRNVSDLASVRFSSRFDGSETFLRDHVVEGRRIMPGVVFLEMARAAIQYAAGAAAGRILELSDVVWVRPLIVDRVTEIFIRVSPTVGDRLGFEIGCGSSVCCQGHAAFAIDCDAARLDPVWERSCCDRGDLRAAECYDTLRRNGIDLGRSMQAVDRIFTGSGRVLVRLVRPHGAPSLSFVLDPALLDGALQGALAFDGVRAKPAMPFMVESVTVRRPCTATMWALLRLRRGTKDPTYDVDLHDDDGELCVRFHGVSLRPMSRMSAAAVSFVLLRQEWQLLEAVAHSSSAFDRRVIVDCGCGVQVPHGADHVSIDVIATEPALSFERAVERLLVLLRDLTDAPGRKLVQLVVPATGLASVHSGLSGLLRTAQQEFPALKAQVFEVDGDGDIEALLERYSTHPEYDAIRVVAGEIRVAAWKESSRNTPVGMLEGLPTPWKPGGVHLITGGAGALGCLFAAEIASNAPDAVIVLVGRSAFDDRIGTHVAAVQARGARVRYEQVDIADRAAVDSLVERIVALYGRLDIIVHAAGIVADAPLREKTVASSRAVLAPKVRGLVNLDEATSEHDLTGLICFGSTAGTHGNPGQGDYAAANAFMAAYASYRNELVASGRRRGRTLSVDWPLWRNGGLRPSATAVARMRRSGMVAMASDTGIEALYRAWLTAESQILVLPRGVDSVARRAPQADTAKSAAPSLIADQVVDMMADLLGLPRGGLDLHAPLPGYGFDSISLTQFVNRLQAEVAPSIGMAEISACETLAEILERVEHARPGARAAVEASELIRMNAIQHGRPVFWVHHGNGGVEVYEPLAQRSARPFFGVPPKGWMTGGEILVGQKAMAAHYVTLIRAVQPEGPYDLGGFSLGGLLAYEVARQLQEAGQLDVTLVMLDTLDSHATGLTNALLTTGPTRRGPISKGAMFRAINLLLGGGNFSADEIAARVLCRDDVDATLDEEAFLRHLVELGHRRGLGRTEAQLRTRTVQLARYFTAMEEEEFAVLPLREPESVTCYYVRNRSGVFLGPHEPHMILYPPAPGSVEAVDHIDYWAEWMTHLPRLQMIDVETSDHSQLLTSRPSLERIMVLCDEVYCSEEHFCADMRRVQGGLQEPSVKAL